MDDMVPHMKTMTVAHMTDTLEHMVTHMKDMLDGGYGGNSYEIYWWPHMDDRLVVMVDILLEEDGKEYQQLL